jgi:hypothetical protein
MEMENPIVIKVDCDKDENNIYSLNYTFFFKIVDGEIVKVEKKTVMERWVQEFSDKNKKRFTAYDIAQICTGMFPGKHFIKERKEEDNYTEIIAILSYKSRYYRIYWHERNNKLIFFDQIAFEMTKITEMTTEWVEV